MSAGAATSEDLYALPISRTLRIGPIHSMRSTGVDCPVPWRPLGNFGDMLLKVEIVNSVNFCKTAPGYILLTCLLVKSSDVLQKIFGQVGWTAIEVIRLEG
jgi:hypothetical protein